MMHYSNRHNVIELGDDIEAIKHVHIAKEGEQTVAYLKAVLDPRKDYQAEDEVHIHLTNGINHRVLGPFKHTDPLAPVTPAQVQGESTQEASVEQAETTEGLNDSEATDDLPTTTRRTRKGHAS